MKKWLMGAMAVVFAMAMAVSAQAEDSLVNKKLRVMFADDFGGLVGFRAFDWIFGATQGIVLITNVSVPERNKAEGKELKEQIEKILNHLARQYGVEKGSVLLGNTSEQAVPITIQRRAAKEESLRAMVVQVKDIGSIIRELEVRKVSYLVLAPQKMIPLFRNR